MSHCRSELQKYLREVKTVKVNTSIDVDDHDALHCRLTNISDCNTINKNSEFINFIIQNKATKTMPHTKLACLSCVGYSKKTLDSIVSIYNDHNIVCLLMLGKLAQHIH